MLSIRLNQAEQRLAVYLARKRHQQARRKGIVDAKIGPQSAWETDLEGIGAELAYCKLMNVYPDLETDTGCPLQDATLKNGATVDVKSTKYATGRLLVRAHKKDIATDLYALMIGEFPQYRLAGHMTADELFQDSYLTDLGHGPTYVAEQLELDHAIQQSDQRQGQG